MAKKQKRDITQQKPVAYKKIKGKFLDFATTFVLLSMLIGPSIVAKDVPSYSTQNKNVAIVRCIADEDVDTSYRNAYAEIDNPIFKALGKMPARIYTTAWQKEIKINMFSQVNDETRALLNEAIKLFNTINERTYTKLPKVVLNYSPTGLDEFNPLNINVYWGTKALNAGEAYRSPLITAQGSSLVGTYINMSNNLRNEPEAFVTTFTHELMHTLFNFADAYSFENFSTDTIMNRFSAGQFLTINDIYLMNTAMWTKELSKSQQKEVRQFYKEYKKMYDSCDGYIISKLYEKIQNQETLEN